MQSIVKWINNLLTEEIHNILEVSQNINQLQNAALLVEKGMGATSFVLYRQDFIKTAIEIKKQNPSMSSKELLGKIQPESILGYIKMAFSSECNAIEVLESAAIKGYGPLMYDIAMAYSGKKGIMSDRDATSSSAQNVWNFYYTKRRSELKIIKLPEDCVDESMPKFLKVKYLALTPIDYSHLISAHQETAKGHGNQQPELTQLLLGVASSFFFQQHKLRT
jgi:hypothetical protein